MIQNVSIDNADSQFFLTKFVSKSKSVIKAFKSRGSFYVIVKKTTLKVIRYVLRENTRVPDVPIAF